MVSKAFDKVCRNKLWLLLIEKGFPNSIIIALLLYYRNAIMLIQIGDEFSSLFTPRLGVRQGGACSPKLFAIYIEDLAAKLDSTGIGIKVTSSVINVMMYADDIILVATSKQELQRLLDITGLFGVERGIKFNPLKCELIIFNVNRKRNQAELIRDSYDGPVTINGQHIPEVNTIKYLGIIFNNDYTFKAHLEKRRKAAFHMLSRIEKLGFNNGCVKPNLVGNMFKTYIRPVVMYGLETMELNETETKKVCKLESSILKRMMGIKQRCYSRHLFNSLRIGLPRRYIKIMKLKFYQRLRSNDYTNKILTEWNELNSKNYFNMAIEKITSSVSGQHINGDQYTTGEKCEIVCSSLHSLNIKNQKDDALAKKLKQLYKMTNRERMIQLTEQLIHAKNAPHGII